MNGRKVRTALFAVLSADRRLARRAARHQVQTIGLALDEVFAAATARPLPAARLEAALQGAVAAGAPRMQAAKAAFWGASEPNPADWDHRQQVYDVAERVVRIVPSWYGGADA